MRVWWQLSSRLVISPGSTRFEWPGDHLDRGGGDITMTGIAELAAARIRRRRVLGGLINEYEGRCGHRRPVAKSQMKGHDARSSHAPVRHPAAARLAPAARIRLGPLPGRPGRQPHGPDPVAEHATGRQPAARRLPRPRREGNLAAVTGLPVARPDIGAVLSADHDGIPRRSLLHMDLRRENILARAGRPAAILDWSNALAGHRPWTWLPRDSTSAPP